VKVFDFHLSALISNDKSKTSTWLERIALTHAGKLKALWMIVLFEARRNRSNIWIQLFVDDQVGFIRVSSTAITKYWQRIGNTDNNKR
jgi:hypothetical protein